MALGDAYASLAEFKAFAGITDTADDTRITSVLASVSRSIDELSGRQFNDAGSTSTRAFAPTGSQSLWLDDFSTTTGLVVKTDPAFDGTYATTIESGYYALHPLNGVRDGVPGFPFNCIKLSDAHFCSGNAHPAVEVTARWGWASVPESVKQATLIQAARVFGRKSSPHGQPIVGAGDFVFRVSIQIDPDVAGLLAPYRLHHIGIA